MRPVLLDLDGFASFRRPTTVDFAGADFFALVGPTGSGKSTVVDAITFALYGSAPRWNNRGAVQYALAPTANRATVRLVFDAGPHRYVVAREVRRTTQGVSQRTVSLERYADPQATGLRDADESSTPLADTITGTTRAIDRLLGLTFEDFCQCVVLPQGQFADFLKATAKQRQDILLKLLGARQYDLIRAAASERSSAARQRADVFENQRDALAFASAEAVAEADARVDALAGLSVEAEAEEAAIAGLQRHQAEAAARRGACERELVAVRAIAVPTAAAAQQAAATQARVDADAAVAREAACGEDYDRARAAVGEAGDPHELRVLDAAWRELGQLDEALPLLEIDCGTAKSAVTVATEEVDRAGWRVEQTRLARDRSTQEADAAEQQLTALEDRRRALAAVALPPGLADLTGRLEAAAARLERADLALDAADVEVDRARAEQDRHDPARLAELIGVVRDRAETRALLDVQQESRNVADAARDAALRSESEAVEAEATARRRRADSAARGVAAGLRAGLTSGDCCPVCDQVITAPPAAADAADIGQAAAEEALSLAEAGTAAARSARGAADSGLAAAEAAVETTRRRLTTLTARLVEAGDLDQARLEAALAAAHRATAAVAAADAAARRARQEARAARAARQALDSEVAGARRLLTETHHPLLVFGAPALDPDLATAWSQLAGWARSAAAELDTRTLPAAVAAAATARDRQQEAEAEWQAARSGADAAAGAQRDAQERHATAVAVLTERRARRGELSGRLCDAPPADDVIAALAGLQRAEDAERDTYSRLTAARGATSSARQRLESARAALDTSRTALTRARDSVAPLGPPEPTGADLLVDWQQLASWAEGESSTRGAALPGLIAAETGAAAAVDRATATLRGRVAAAAVPVGEADGVARIRLLLATAVTAAQAARDQAERDLQAFRRAERDLSAAREQHDVAGTLATLLQANRFQRWLAGAALETLVQGASASLLELSGGQFDLTHSDGEFYVVDHADAEAERSVRTLSGGETFQTSLALALALSEQLSSLTAGGTRLDSIVLDEGFGTLDDASLDVVASTLERLAQGDRMVGIITHVRELADRVPVRYQVRRDSTGSHVTRESL